jgi:8-oxo-dGTP pyrophosphatase MutT (NUDIX family)
VGVTKFTRIEPTESYDVGGLFTRRVVVKRFGTSDNQVHQFTTYYKEGSHSGAVIALTPDARVIVSYQFRAGPERWMYELPGGGFKDDETYQSAVMRELTEETGYTSDDVVCLGTSCRDAYVNTIWHYYLAKNCVLSPGGQQLDDEERAQGLTAKLISIDDLFYNATHDRMTDPAAVLMAYEELKEIQRGTQ